MAGSSFGTIFKITTWGESHGDGIGVVVDGCPAGITFDEEQVQAYLNRRKPGQTRYSTPRKENDSVKINSGLFEGHTTGTPISMAVYNETQRSADYSEIAGYYRPGHADFTYDGGRTCLRFPERTGHHRNGLYKIHRSHPGFPHLPRYPDRKAGCQPSFYAWEGCIRCRRRIS